MNGSYRTKLILEEICANEGFHDSDVFRKGQFIWQRCNQRYASAGIIAFFGALFYRKASGGHQNQMAHEQAGKCPESMVIGLWTTYCVQ